EFWVLLTELLSGASLISESAFSFPLPFVDFFSDDCAHHSEPTISLLVSSVLDAKLCSHSSDSSSESMPINTRSKWSFVCGTLSQRARECHSSISLLSRMAATLQSRSRSL